MEKQSPPWLKPLLKRYLSPTHNLLNFFELLVQDYDIVRIPDFRRTFIVNDPEAIYHILLTNEANYTKLGTSYEGIKKTVGEGLLTASGKEWVLRHQQYQPLFHGKQLRNYVATSLKHTDDLLQRWETKGRDDLNIGEEMSRLAINIASESLLGIDVSDRTLSLIRTVHSLNQNAAWKWLPTIKNMRYQLSRKKIDNFILSSLKNQTTAPYEPLLKPLLLKDEEGKFLLSERYILGEIKNFFLAGHETTGNALSWTLYCLAKHPYVLKKLQIELKEVLGTREPDFNTIEDLSYLHIVIQESLRLYPVIWTFTRKAINDDKLLQYEIPAGSIINILPYLIHRHPKYWSQPSIFYPERFLQANKMRPKCSYIPFGVGPRVCIGRQFALMNIKLILSRLLQRFEVHLPHKHYAVEPLPLITIKPGKNLTLKIKRLA